MTRSSRHRTSELLQGKVLAVLQWDRNYTIEQVALAAGVSEDIAHSALEDLAERRMVAVVDQDYWRKQPVV